MLNRIKEQGPTIIFIALFAVFAGFYYDGLLEKGPISMHQWRQADCLSFTKMYQEGAPFFSPELHYQGADELQSGKSAGEFPILYYIMGNIWKMTGESYLVYRLFYLLILLVGQLAMFKSMQIILKNNFWSITLSLLFFTSPVYAFYGVGFLTDIPSFSFNLMGFYFLIRYHLNGRIRFFALFVFFVCLAGLIKISSLIPFLFLSIILLIESLGIRTLGHQKVFRRHKLEWLGISIVLLTVLCWYLYVSFYNSVHGFKYTFNTIHLTQDWSSNFMLNLFEKVFYNMFPSLFNRLVLACLLILLVVNFLSYKKLSLFAYLSNAIVFIGVGMYFYLWMPLFQNHDYYYTPFLYLQLSIVLPFMASPGDGLKNIINHQFAKGFMTILLTFSFLYCWGAVQMRRGKEAKITFIYPKVYMNHMQWINQDSQNWLRFEKIRPYLSNLGVKKNDKIISVPDPSFTISLYLSGHKGWTYFNSGPDNQIWGLNSRRRIWQTIDKGAKYMLISEVHMLSDSIVAPFTKNKLGEYMNIHVFKLPDRGEQEGLQNDL